MRDSDYCPVHHLKSPRGRAMMQKIGEQVAHAIRVTSAPEVVATVLADEAPTLPTGEHK